MKSNLLLIPIIMLISGCATTEPAIQTIIQRVEVPIEVPCKQEIPVKPDFNFDDLREEDPLFDKTKALLADRKLHIAYEEELLAALKACK